MPYVITAPCVADYSCVEVCPADCIHPTPDEPGFGSAEQLYINPQECIDCGACMESCPVDAVFSDDLLPDRYADYPKINSEHFADDQR